MHTRHYYDMHLDSGCIASVWSHYYLTGPACLTLMCVSVNSSLSIAIHMHATTGPEVSIRLVIRSLVPLFL